MKCYYEVLNVDRDAESGEIKNAYRKLALKWHPDKNLENAEEAKEQFQSVQNAYEVLSDPQERAWYDNHREQLLRGAGTSFNDESLDLIPYFTPTCYRGFGDDEKSFYSVYREVFKKLAAEEVDYLDDPEDVKNIPMFGKSDTVYEDVHEFYAYWMSFSTSKSYVWLDKFDIREADNRKILKLLEKENNKIRQKARKDRNEEIRQLVNFVRKRDKRVQAYSKLLLEKAEENKRKAETIRKEKLAQRLRDIEEAKKRQSDVPLYSMTDFHEQLEQIEKHYAEEFGHSDDEETLTGPSDNEDDSYTGNKNEITGQVDSVKEKASSAQRLYCTACDKLFKNIKSFENHENSKKHKDNVLNMTLDVDVNLSDGELTQEDDVEEDFEELKPNEEQNGDKSDSDSSLQNNCVSKKKKNKNKKKPFEVLNEDLDEHTHIDELSNGTRSRRARKAKNLEKLKNNKDKIVENDVEIIKDKGVLHVPAAVVEESCNVENHDTQNLDVEESEILEDNKNKPNKKAKKAKEKKYTQKQKDIIASSINVTTFDSAHCCAVCKVDFSSKNKLFEHLKTTGHQIFLPNSQAASVQKVSKKKSGKVK